MNLDSLTAEGALVAASEVSIALVMLLFDERDRPAVMAKLAAQMRERAGAYGHASPKQALERLAVEFENLAE